ncbi:MAG: ABC transporter substrate-binding protein [Candidatus Omnitrophica bacterium]|nr:ABC transporter substrate-binding protein [Candidatus Omnitrophota bacterium]
MDERFDWTAIARSCLGRYWAQETPAKQKEFVSLFSDFLERTYLDKFETYYNDLDRIDYLGERIVDGYASVKVVVRTKEQINHPVEYRLSKSSKDNAWQIYDVLIEGISLVQNYRDQLSAILSQSSFEGLIKDLKAKLGKDTQ